MRRAAVSAAVLALAVCAPARAAVPFAVLPPSAAGMAPMGIAAADLDGDGRPDLATTDSDGGRVWVLHGTGAARFASAPVDVGQSPRTLAVADFNGDGRPDIAAARFGGNDVAVLLGSSFALAPSPFGTGASPRFVATADFNGDLHTDLATVDLSAPSLSIGLGNGAGGFGPVAGTPLNFPHGLNGLVAADFDGDGVADLATGNADDGTVTLLLGTGVGSVNPQTPVAAGQATGELVAADLDGDGKTDLAVADTTAHAVVTLLGDGAGGFAAPTATAVGAGPSDIAVGDFDRDGRPDLAVVTGAGVSVLLGDGDGSFTAQPAIAVGGTPQSAAVADFDDDGWVDIAVTQTLGVSVLANWSGPHAELSPADAQDLGSVTVGSVGAERTFTVTARGTETLRVDAVGLAGAGFRIAHDGCSHAVLGVGSACTVRVAFAPGVAGTHAATLSVTSNGPAVGVSLSARGTAPPAPPPPVARCVARRSLVIHPPKAMRGGRVTVTLRGRVIKRVKRAGRTVTIRLTGRPAGVVRVTMKHGRKRIVRKFDTCVPQRRR